MYTYLGQEKMIIITPKGVSDHLIADIIIVQIPRPHYGLAKELSLSRYPPKFTRCARKE